MRDRTPRPYGNMSIAHRILHTLMRERIGCIGKDACPNRIHSILHHLWADTTKDGLIGLANIPCSWCTRTIKGAAHTDKGDGTIAPVLNIFFPRPDQFNRLSWHP